MTARRSPIGAFTAVIALSVSGCAFMFDSPDLDNPLDASVWTFDRTDHQVTARDLLLKKVTPKSTSIDEARAYLELLGANCQRETSGQAGYLCVRERIFPVWAMFPFSIVEQANHYTFRVRLIELAGKLDDISVKIDLKHVDY